MRYIVPVTILLVTAGVMFATAPTNSPRDVLIELLAVLVVLAADWARTSWYERRLARKNALLRDALTTLQEDLESHQSAGASARD